MVRKIVKVNVKVYILTSNLLTESGIFLLNPVNVDQSTDSPLDTGQLCYQGTRGRL